LFVNTWVVAVQITARVPSVAPSQIVASRHCPAPDSERDLKLANTAQTVRNPIGAKVYELFTDPSFATHGSSCPMHVGVERLGSDCTNRATGERNVDDVYHRTDQHRRDRVLRAIFCRVVERTQIAAAYLRLLCATRL
jgi:hypothetical protein